MVTVQGQLGLEGIPDKLVRVTPARLGTWERCPRKYRMMYLDRPSPSKGGPWAHSTLGAVVHNALRALLESSPERRTPERAVTLLHRYWTSDGFADAEQAARYRRRAERWITDYAAELDERTRPIALERWVSGSAGTIIAEGRVDRIDQLGDELVVIDYKTGRHTPSTSDAANSLPLALYALAVRKTFRAVCRRVELHHVPSGRILSWEHTEDSLREHREAAERLAAEIQQATDALADGADPGDTFPPRPGPQCSRCEVRAHCSEGQRAAPEIPPWALLADQTKA